MKTFIKQRYSSLMKMRIAFEKLMLEKQKIDEFHVLILRREDLVFRSKNNTFNEIDLSCFMLFTSAILKYSIIVFFDHDKKFKILKNRYGSL